MSWLYDETKTFNKGRKGTTLLKYFEKFAKEISYDPKIKDIEKEEIQEEPDTDLGNLLHEEISSYPSGTKLKKFMAKGPYFLATHNFFAIVDPNKMYKKLKIIHYADALTGAIALKKFENSFSEFEMSINFL